MSYTQFLYLKLEPHQNWCRYWFHCHIKRTSSPYQRSIYPIPISMGMEVNQNEMKLTKSNGIGAMLRKHVLTHSNVSNNHIKHNNMFNVFFPCATSSLLCIHVCYKHTHFLSVSRVLSTSTFGWAVFDFCDLLKFVFFMWQHSIKRFLIELNESSA